MKTKKLFFKLLVALLTCALPLFTLSSCYTPSPLYGTWADNDGNRIIFRSDGTFSATVYTGTDSSGDSVSENYSGTYTVVDNVLIFTFESGSSKNTTWDIWGAILYLTWTEDSELSLTLYHISR